MSDEPALIVLGRITGTHGIRGELKIHSYSGDPSTLQSLGRVTLRAHDGATETFRLRSVRPHGKWILIALAGYDDINAVLPLIGREVVVDRSELPPTGEDEYYWCDLLGMTVVTTDGKTLGTLEEIYETGSNDVYAVRNGRREYLIPAIADIVLSVDLPGRVMTIAPFEGLFDL
jgi:16S rRNA processing protein RimM